MLRKIISLYSVKNPNKKNFSSAKQYATITTPIFYLNSDPHIGHLYTLLISDCIARWHKFKDYDVITTNGIFNKILSISFIK